MKFVNVYEVTREYGGPEEGGWWFDCLTPIKSVRANTKRLRKKVLKRLERLFPNPGTAGRILGGDPGALDSVDDIAENDMQGVHTGFDTRIIIEGRPAHHWPRPHYE
jgi:hypothetical protein